MNPHFAQFKENIVIIVSNCVQVGVGQQTCTGIPVAWTFPSDTTCIFSRMSNYSFKVWQLKHLVKVRKQLWLQRINGQTLIVGQ